MSHCLKTGNSILQSVNNDVLEIGPSDGGVGAHKKPSAFQKFFMTEKLSNYTLFFL